MEGVKALVVLASIYYPGDGIVAKNNYQTSSGQRYDQSAPKCAALQWPLGTMLHLVHGRNNIDVTINDHGPYRRGRALDCTPAVDKALHLGRFRLGTRRSLSAVAEGAASGGASTALLKMLLCRVATLVNHLQYSLRFPTIEPISRTSWGLRSTLCIPSANAANSGPSFLNNSSPFWDSSAAFLVSFSSTAWSNWSVRSSSSQYAPIFCLSPLMFLTAFWAYAFSWSALGC